MRTLEKRIERCVEGFAKETSRELGSKKSGNSGESIVHVVHRLWNAQTQRNSVALSEITPLYANAIAAMREKTAELAPEFLKNYRNQLEHSEGAQRFLRPVFENRTRKFIVAITAAAVTYGALVSAQYRTPLGGALIFTGGLLLAVAIQAYANLPNKRARQERSNFEETIKSEFYRVAKGP